MKIFLSIHWKYTQPIFTHFKKYKNIVKEIHMNRVRKIALMVLCNKVLMIFIYIDLLSDLDWHCLVADVHGLLKSALISVSRWWHIQLESTYHRHASHSHTLQSHLHYNPSQHVNCWFRSSYKYFGSLWASLDELNVPQNGAWSTHKEAAKLI